MVKGVSVSLLPMVLIGLSACAQTPGASASAPSAVEARSTTKPSYREHDSLNVAPEGASSMKEPEERPLMDRMAQDLARRLSVRVVDLQVLAADSVVWSDSALGCPQPGHSYLQMQTPGVRVLFQHQGKTYQYHASERGNFVYCPNPAEPAGGFDVK